MAEGVTTTESAQQIWRLTHYKHEHKVALPPSLALALGVPDGGKVAVRCGSARVHLDAQTHVFPGSQTAHDQHDQHDLMQCIGLAPPVLAKLGLSAGQAVHGRAEAGVLRLGPLVGILAPRRSGHAKPYQAQTSLFKRLFAAAQRLGIALYVFDFHDIHWAGKQVRGFAWNGSSWYSRLYPLPDVVYDRATGTFPGGSGAADVARRKLAKSHGIPLFNTRLGNKLRLHRLMHTDAVLRHHLPPTHRVTDSAVVAGVLANHRGAYMKPQNGTQGKGIVRLRRSPKGVQYTLTTDSYQRVQGTAATAAGALARLRSWGVRSGYLVQPELSLIRINGRICDVRALVQRDETGVWRVTGMGVRAGQPGSVVSNLHGGGRALQVAKVLKQALGIDTEKVRQLQEELESVALRVAEVLSRTARCIGELGIDLGVDTKGRVWIIEANSRTGRATFRRAGMPETAWLADSRPLLFAKYLAGFTT